MKKLITGDRVDLENELVKPYVGEKNELSISSEGIILKSNQIVFSKELQLLVIRIGHENHQCAEKTKQLMNRLVWFPGMNAAIDRFVKSCEICQVNSEKRNFEPLKMSIMPQGPWMEL